MTIRQATRADIPRLLEMAGAFLHTTAYGRLFRATPESLTILVELLFQLGENAAIFLACDPAPIGMIALVAAPHPFDQRLYADEVVWWVDPTSRGARQVGPALLGSAEDWARSRNCYMIKMVAPFGSSVGAYYERLGYSPVETAYAKGLEVWTSS